jgi:hypothetical protein
MAEKVKQSNILWLALIGGAIYYFWKKKKERDAQIRALAQRQGGQEVGGGGGGGFGGGGITPLTPVITGQGSDGEDTEINVNVETSDPTPPSAIDCIKFPNTAGCENTIQQAEEPKQIAEPSFANPSGMGGGTAGGGLSTGGAVGGGTTGGTTPQGNTGATTGGVNVSTSGAGSTQTATAGTSAGFSGTLNMGQKKAWDFDGDFDYMDKGNGRAKTDFDGEL